MNIHENVSMNDHEQNEFPVAEITGGQAMHDETYRCTQTCLIQASFPGRQRPVAGAESPITRGRIRRKKMLGVETIRGVPVVNRGGLHMQDENMSINNHTPQMCLPTVETTAG